MHRDHAQVEAVIASLVEERQRLSRDSREAALKRARAESLLRELEAEREQLRAGREKIRQQAREEARQLLRRTRKEADQILRELRQIRSQGGTGALARGEELRRQLHRLQEAEEQPGEEEEARREILPPESLAPGAAVLVGSLNRRGEILSLDGEEALVQVGAMKVTVPVADLGRWQEEEAGEAGPGTPGRLYRAEGGERLSPDRPARADLGRGAAGGGKVSGRCPLGGPLPGNGNSRPGDGAAAGRAAPLFSGAAPGKKLAPGLAQRGRRWGDHPGAVNKAGAVPCLRGAKARARLPSRELSVKEEKRGSGAG